MRKILLLQVPSELISGEVNEAYPTCPCCGKIEYTLEILSNNFV
jgi:hypothetical protein